MVKKIERFTLLVGLWIGWVGHHAVLAIEPSTDLAAQNNFFGKNGRSSFHIGIKGWVKGTKKVIEQHWALGGELAIGPLVEWHPLNGIALQTGLLYSYNYFFTIDFSVDRKKLLDAGLYSFGHRLIAAINGLSAKKEGYIAHTGLDSIAFHAISLPLFIRFYPEKSRKLVCYGGPRFLLLCAGIDRRKHCPIHIDTSIIKNIFYDALKNGKAIADERGITVQDIQNIAQGGVFDIYHSIFNIKPDRVQNELLPNQVYIWDLIWDFGVEFRGSSGLMIGVNGLGIVLGYDFIN
ncbi:hypothetical protein [Cardinium endosymbiont of Philonthus spinipes]|uniref:hypothetical protein n=1 Tax=Cardinium endosymbiont of Philonthus spinipes TaxID=3077941 RepID=UPI00313AA002